MSASSSSQIGKIGITKSSLAVTKTTFGKGAANYAEIAQLRLALTAGLVFLHRVLHGNCMQKPYPGITPPIAVTHFIGLLYTFIKDYQR